MYATFWALVPPIVAIALALITKEVYSSLFIGILVGGLFYSGFNFEGTLVHIFNLRRLQRRNPDLPGLPRHHGMSDEQGRRIRCLR